MTGDRASNSWARRISFVAASKRPRGPRQAALGPARARTWNRLGLGRRRFRLRVVPVSLPPVSGGKWRARVASRCRTWTSEQPRSYSATRVLALLRRRGLVSHERIDLLLSWRRSGFSVHNRVFAHSGDGRDFEALVRYMMRSPVSLKRLSFTPGAKEVVYTRRRGHHVDPGLARELHVLAPQRWTTTRATSARTRRSGISSRSPSSRGSRSWCSARCGRRWSASSAPSSPTPRTAGRSCWRR